MLLRSEHPIANRVIEQRAGELHRRYFLKFPPAALPIPVERIIEVMSPLLISWEPIASPRGGGIVLGEIRAEQRKLVLNDNAQPHFTEFPGSDNFTLAHELGHWILHVKEEPAEANLFTDLPGRPPIVVCTNAAEKPMRERQADRFASYVLMPADLVRAEAARREPREWPALYRFREFLGVSISALCYRLEELAILSIVDEKIVYHS
ncbi:MAG: ImmA/IrrE family metallo-endopeptidase [Chloroflexota bacterium]|nr:ImmA/IrrE family metallo-endopeptidase [Chloroflexota bacterium]